MKILRYTHFYFFAVGAITATLVFRSELPTGAAWAYLAFYIYLVPPLTFQFFSHFVFRDIAGDLSKSAPRSHPGSSTFALWWISSQLQVHYLRFPFLEEFIKIFPGAYSAWLRLWGAKMGKNILWTPRVLIVDRPYLDIGSDVIVGAETRMTSHFVNRTGKTAKDFELFLGTIFVGDGATLGGSCDLWPGCRVEPGQIVPATSDVNNGTVFRAPSLRKEKTHAG